MRLSGRTFRISDGRTGSRIAAFLRRISKTRIPVSCTDSTSGPLKAPASRSGVPLTTSGGQSRAVSMLTATPNPTRSCPAAASAGAKLLVSKDFSTHLCCLLGFRALKLRCVCTRRCAVDELELESFFSLRSLLDWSTCQHMKRHQEPCCMANRFKLLLPHFCTRHAAGVAHTLVKCPASRCTLLPRRETLGGGPLHRWQQRWIGEQHSAAPEIS